MLVLHAKNFAILKRLVFSHRALIIQDLAQPSQNARLAFVDPLKDEKTFADLLRRHFDYDLPVVQISSHFFHKNLKFQDFHENLADHAQKDEISEIFFLILRTAIHKNASDIHVENIGPAGLLRFRIYGVLESIAVLDPEIFRALCVKIKLECRLDITEIRAPQDGRYALKIGTQDFDFRVSCVPLSHLTQSIVIRILYKHEENIEFFRLGISENQLPKILNAAQKNSGLILVTGATGSGKSTTLYALLREISRANPGKKFITIEDPIEYELPFATQVAVNDELGFDTALRAILRQDPDVIMVGEIRDTVTLQLVFRAALTGHLVLSTMHTNDVKNTIARLLNMGVGAHEISSTLLLVFSQSLVPKFCEFCGGIQDLESDFGCEKCDFGGLLGRTVISEVLPIDFETRRAILANELELHLQNTHFTGIADDARKKILAKKIPENVLKGL